MKNEAVTAHSDVAAAARVCRKCASPFLGARCLDCEKIAKAAYRKENKSKIDGYDALYRAANAAKLRAYQANYRELHPEKSASARNKSMSKYRSKNPEIIAASKRKWRLANMDASRMHHHNRAAKIRLSGGRISVGLAARLLLLQRGMCANCRIKLLSSGHHLDHIMPVALGGENVDGNIQLLCPPCNLKKHAKHPIEWAQQQGRLL